MNRMCDKWDVTRSWQHVALAWRWSHNEEINPYSLLCIEFVEGLWQKYYQINGYKKIPKIIFVDIWDLSCRIFRLVVGIVSRFAFEVKTSCCWSNINRSFCSSPIRSSMICLGRHLSFCTGAHDTDLFNVRFILNWQRLVSRIELYMMFGG